MCLMSNKANRVLAFKRALIVGIILNLINHQICFRR